MTMRVGSGFDVHAFGPGDSVALGGLRVPHAQGVVAHSDGDVILHAVSDALLGAAGLGDIGQHFPDTDPQWKGADSMLILRAVVQKVRDAGWNIANVDVNVICERPKIAPNRDAMQANLAAALGAPASVKGRRAEQLGSIGRGEGVVCLAVALLTT